MVQFQYHKCGTKLLWLNFKSPCLTLTVVQIAVFSTLVIKPVKLPTYDK